MEEVRSFQITYKIKGLYLAQRQKLITIVITLQMQLLMPAFIPSIFSHAETLQLHSYLCKCYFLGASHVPCTENPRDKPPLALTRLVMPDSVTSNGDMILMHG